MFNKKNGLKSFFAMFRKQNEEDAQQEQLPVENEAATAAVQEEIVDTTAEREPNKTENLQVQTTDTPEQTQETPLPEDEKKTEPKEEPKTEQKVAEKTRSDNCSVRVPEAPYGPKIASITKAGIEFYWKKPEVADGYLVFRSYREDGPFEQIALIDKRRIGTYIDSNFDRERREVFYTVCSYVDDGNGNRINSEKLKPTVAKYREEMIPERDVTYIYSGMSRKIRAFSGWGEPANVEWKSDNEDVATISKAGVISAISAGECTICCVDLDTEACTTTRVVVDREADEPLSTDEPRYCYDRETGFWKNADSDQSGNAVIMMVGDMMCGKRQMEAQFSEGEGWNFNGSYAYVREITASADFAIGNLETLLASGWPYMIDETYINNTNNCNATPRYLDAIRYGGFDAVVMANNHNCDGGPRALLQTIEQVDKYKFPRTGVFANAEERRFFIADVKGIKVGFVSYNSKDTGFNGKEASWTGDERNVLLNIFDAEKAKRDICACREAGAEYVIAYMHWGFKNFREIAAHQIEEAKIVADAGADYIVGSNPHLVQIYDEITAADGRIVPCAYSVGNFQAVMNQVKGNRYSVVLRAVLKRNEEGKVVLADNSYIPCLTYTDINGHLWAPLALSDNFHAGVFRKGRKTVRKRIEETMGTKIKVFR